MYNLHVAQHYTMVRHLLSFRLSCTARISKHARASPRWTPVMFDVRDERLVHLDFSARSSVLITYIVRVGVILLVLAYIHITPYLSIAPSQVA